MKNFTQKKFKSKFIHAVGTKWTITKIKSTRYNNIKSG